MSEINLLSKQKGVYSLRVRVFAILRATALFLLAFVAFSSIVLFILKLTSPLPGLKKQENDLLNRLSSSKQQVATLLIIHDRLTTISSVIANRPDFEKTIVSILQKLPTGVTLDSMSVSKTKISLSASSVSLLPLDTFLNGLTDLSNKNVFKTTTLTSLTVDEKLGKYIASVEIEP